jgi:hypothetical protein
VQVMPPPFATNVITYMLFWYISGTSTYGFTISSMKLDQP